MKFNMIYYSDALPVISILQSSLTNFGKIRLDTI